ncbi:MAG: hypothetical protein A2V70_06750 [Planctomycetes bacterium RBG_13_63_9]|nr:MAG: hypothetical protein A2V70_06750 [Planctomycetes bacterium RBG_13_63_9]
MSAVGDSREGDADGAGLGLSGAFDAGELGLSGPWPMAAGAQASKQQTAIAAVRVPERLRWCFTILRMIADGGDLTTGPTF